MKYQSPEALYQASLAQKDKLFIVPFGGCGEFGKNCMGLFVAGEMYLIDAGAMFPDHRKLGIQIIIGDIEPFVQAFGGIAAYVMTHGHEDHIGALPYYYQKWKAPIYATPWTRELIERKFRRVLGTFTPEMVTLVHAGDIVDLEEMTVEYIHVNHSIPDACSLHVRTKRGDIGFFHSGDFKIDDTGKFDAPINFERLKEIGKQGIQLFVADSTNAHLSDSCPTEGSVKQRLRDVLTESKGRVVLTTFASNLWRLMTVLELARELKKKILIIGSGIAYSLETADKLGHLKLADQPIVDIKNVSGVKDRDLIIFASGCQAEGRAGVARLAFDAHKTIRLRADDRVIFSSRSIPGNERDIAFVTSLIEKKGCQVITPRNRPGIHVSGHAFGGDIQKFLDCLKPTYFLPIHGNFSQLQASRKNRTYNNAFKSVLENGELIILDKNEAQREPCFETGIQYVDADSHQLLSYDVMRQRLKVGEVGLVLVEGCYDATKSFWIQGPHFTAVGLNIPDQLREKMKTACLKANTKNSKPKEIQELIRIEVRRKLDSFLHKKPVVRCCFHIKTKDDL